MTEDIRNTVLSEASKRGLSQNQLAEIADITPTQLSRMMQGKSNALPKAWATIFEALNLKVLLVPADAVVKVESRVQ